MTSASPAGDPTGQLRELVRTGRFREALETYRVAADTGPRADARLLAATAATRLGELELAETLAGEAVQRFVERGDFDGRMRALNLLGVIGFERGRLAEAEHRLTEALGIAYRLEDSLLAARACNNLASVAHLRGRPEEAVGLYRGALLGYQRIGDRRGTAETYHNLGLTYRQIADYGEAEKAVTQAVRHAESVGEPTLMALTSGGRAELRIDQGNPELALPELDRASRMADLAGDVIGVAELRRVSAVAAWRQGRYDDAAREAEAGRRTAVEHGVALLRGECAALAALAHRALSRMEAAETRRAEAVEIFGALGAVMLLRRFEEQWSGGAAAGRRPPG
jgi:ATP/maltotriose-dependent transcriptional regulator MalT